MEHDTLFSTVQFKVDDVNIIYAIPNKLKEITEITDYEDGFLTMQTNYGEEYTDLIDLIENSLFEDNFKEKAINALRKLKINDIILRVV